MSVVRIQLRRGLSTDWTDVDPVLAPGEIGLEVDTNKFKIGNDNEDSWTQLPYANITPTGLGDSLSDYVLLADVGQANGVASLDSDGLVPTNQLPPLVKVTVNTVADQTARLALTAQPGDIAIQEDNKTSYVLSTSPATTNSNWKELIAETSAGIVASAQIETHNLDTTNVHGITDTANLATLNGNQTLTNKTISYSNNTITIQAANVSDFDEIAQDLMNNTIIGGTNIDTSYNDNAGTLTLNLSDNVILSGDLSADVIGANSMIVTGEIQAGSVSIDGDLTVNGTYNTVPVESLTVSNSIIYMADGNVGNTLDIGIVGSHTISGTYSHTGFIKDATDGVWKLFTGITTEPTTTVDFSSWTKDTMQLGVLYADEIHVGNVSNTEIQHLNGVTSDIQTQIDSKVSTSDANSNFATKANPTFTGTVTLPNTTSIGDVSATEISYLNAVTSSIQTQIDGKQDIVSGVSDTEIGYLNGVTSAIQNQLDDKAPIASPTFTGAVVLPSNTTIGNVLSTEISYLDGVSSSIQTQLNGKASSSVISDLSDHENATTSVHGIADTSLLATKSYVGSELGTHESDTSTHGVVGNIVGTSDTQTLTNKTISASNNVLTIAPTDLTGVTATASELNTLDGITASTSELNILDGVTASASELNILDGATLTTTELNYVDGVTSPIQTQLDGKSSTSHTHLLASGATDVTATAAEVNKLAGLATTKTEFGYVAGVTSAIQTQLDAKAPLASPTFTGTVTLPSGTVTSTMIADGTIVNADINASAAIALSKLATDPLARANHTGTQTAGTISDFNTQVRTSKVTDLAAPTSSFSMNSQKITSLADPTADQDAATKAYVDAATAGLNVHASVKAATTANITLATDVENGDTLDGVTLATGNRILIKNQTTKSQNGVYTVNATGAPTRATDYDSTPEVDAGDFIFVESGTVNGKTGWVQTNVISTIGTDAIEFTQFSGSGTYSAGTGLTLTGTTFSINTATTVDTSTSQTLTNKTINGSNNTITNVSLTSGVTGTLPVANGGTGVTSSTGTGSVVLSSSPTLTTPTLGSATATSINGTTIPSSKTLVVTTDKLSVLAATSSSELAGVISDETGSGSLVFANSPTLVTPTLGAATATSIAFSDGTQSKEGVPSRTPIVTKSASFGINDNGTSLRDSMIECDSTSTITITIPTDGTNGLTYPTGTSIDFLRTNTGAVTFTGPLVTFNNTPGANLRDRWSSATLFKRAANTWVLLGDLSA